MLSQKTWAEMLADDGDDGDDDDDDDDGGW